MRPRAVDVKPLEDYKLLVTFNNNETRVFDVKPYLDFKPFEQLRNKEIFKTVRVGGLSVEWVTGQDVCPDELYYNSNVEN
ncbi:MAG TPA: DUF2442 domain-containing protein [Clostridiales bacterium]|nr:DUF2442 domain-containing protein [Clostridiales bacterium]